MKKNIRDHIHDDILNFFGNLIRGLAFIRLIEIKKNKNNLYVYFDNIFSIIDNYKKIEDKFTQEELEALNKLKKNFKKVLKEESCQDILSSNYNLITSKGWKDIKNEIKEFEDLKRVKYIKFHPLVSEKFRLENLIEKKDSTVIEHWNKGFKQFASLKKISLRFFLKYFKYMVMIVLFILIIVIPFYFLVFMLNSFGVFGLIFAVLFIKYTYILLKYIYQKYPKMEKAVKRVFYTLLVYLLIIGMMAFIGENINPQEITEYVNKVTEEKINIKIF